MQDKKPETQALEDDGLVVVPTPEYVKDLIEEHAQSRTHPDATLQDKGFVILSNDVGSDSETMAATPKAVKAAYDLANTANSNANVRLAKDQNGVDIPNKVEFVNNLGLRDTVNQALNAVSNSRKINGKSLSSDINLNAEDVGTYGRTEIDNLFGRKNFAKLEGNGWWQCGDTGLIIQWGMHRFQPLVENIVKLPKEFKHVCLSIQIVDAGGLAVPMAASPNGALNSFRAWVADRGFDFKGNEFNLIPDNVIVGQYIAIGY
ncbi:MULTISPECIES: tail fiber protein [Xenorhabdus]|uniref:tail fiber protein n=1 Tax=Xenorhabdus TaxID=626 RepID=UPI00069CBA5C|nr:MULTISPECIES: phage tail protein [Xenorhabdus]